MSIASELINELAVFSAQQFLFGIDTSQIQEIVTIKSPEFLAEPNETSTFFVLRYQQQPLPVLNTYNTFHLPLTSARINGLFSVITFVTFTASSQRVACWVDTVETMLSAESHCLQAVPPMLTRAARHLSIWGFYEYTDHFASRIIPLIDLEHILRKHDLEEWTAIVSTLHLPPG